MKTPGTQFTCEHCGEGVRFAIWRGQPKPRNHCPACLWSKHISIGAEAGYPPCGAMMRGVDVGGDEVVWRCLGCGFMMRGPTDDYIFRTVTAALGSSAQLTVYGATQTPERK